MPNRFRACICLFPIRWYLVYFCIMSTNWNILETEGQWENLLAESHQQTVAVFKHSTRCPVSFSIKSYLEKEWDLPTEDVSFHYLDLIRYRSISNRIANELGVQHESPQLILIRNGQVVFHDSHFGIQMGPVRQALA